MKPLIELVGDVKNMLRGNPRDVIEIISLSEQESLSFMKEFSGYDLRRAIVIPSEDKPITYILYISKP